MASLDESTGEYDEISPSAIRRDFRLEIAAITHPGLARDNNEDSYLVARLVRAIEVETTSLPAIVGARRSDHAGHLLIVADGMGGVEGGERASMLAIETIEAFCRTDFRSFLHHEPNDEAALYRELKSGIEKADLAVLKCADSDPKLAGMGTTLTMAYGVANVFHVLHVGDSRAYHFHQDKLRQVTTDHTLVQMLVESRAIAPEEARTHPKRNVVTNVVGGPEEGIYVETHTLTLDDGDLLLLCSDGLTEAVDHESIESILRNQPDQDTALKALLAKALDAGAPDNVTILVARAHIA